MAYGDPQLVHTDSMIKGVKSGKMAGKASCITDFMKSAANKKQYPDVKDRMKAAAASCKSSAKTSEGPFQSVVQLDEATVDDSGIMWMHALHPGTIEHPQFGTIDMTPEKIQGFVDSVDGRVRGIDLDVDYDHKAKRDDAAGWIQQAEVREGDLWLGFAPTTEGKEKIESKAYRYASIDYVDEWTDEAGNKYDNVLMGAALTNRPFIKDLLPINFSEMSFADSDTFDVPDGQYSQDDAGLSEAYSSTRRCLNCAFFKAGTSNEDFDKDGDGGSCLVVDGVVDPDQVCQFFEAIYKTTSNSLLMADIEGKAKKLRDIPAKERKAASGADFAGKNRSFAILKSEDVSAAARSLGRAGSDNYSRDQIKSNIIKIANRKGWSKYLPKSWQEGSTQTSEGGDNELDTVKLAEILGTPDETDEEKLLAEVTALTEYKTAHPDEPEKVADKKFEEDYPDQAKHMAELREINLTNAVNTVLTELHNDKSAKRGLPVKLDEQITAISREVADDPELTKKFNDLLADIVKTGLVDFSVTGGPRDPAMVNDNAEDFPNRVKTYMEEKKVDYGVALAEVSKQEPELAKQYLSSVPSVG